MKYEQSMFAYFATRNTFDRLLCAISEQISLGLGTAKYSYLFTDETPDALPTNIKQFFGNRVCVNNPYFVDIDSKSIYALSKARNAAIKYARKTDVDWLHFCDADTVIYNIELPASDQRYVSPSVYWQKHSEESVKESISHIERYGPEAFSDGNSWFILHREIFNKYDFNENIYSYGFEDLEFCYRIQKMGYIKGRCNTRIVHLYHSDEVRNINQELYERNRQIYEAAVIKIENGLEENWRHTKCIKTYHPEWSAYLYFDYSSDIVIYSIDHSICTFKDDGVFVIIDRSAYVREKYCKFSGSLKYIGTL